MNKYYKEKWLALLRSGAYSKGTRFLRKSHNFCAMGLAYEALCKTHKLQYGWHKQELSIYATSPEGNPCALSPELLAVLDLTAEQQSAIVGMSDGGSSFEEIAEWVQENIASEQIL